MPWEHAFSRGDGTLKNGGPDLRIPYLLPFPPLLKKNAMAAQACLHGTRKRLTGL